MEAAFDANRRIDMSVDELDGTVGEMLLGPQMFSNPSTSLSSLARTSALERPSPASKAR